MSIERLNIVYCLLLFSSQLTIKEPTYPSGGLKHDEVQGVPTQDAIDDGEGVTSRHGIQEKALLCWQLFYIIDFLRKPVKWINYGMCKLLSKPVNLTYHGMC